MATLSGFVRNGTRLDIGVDSALQASTAQLFLGPPANNTPIATFSALGNASDSFVLTSSDPLLATELVNENIFVTVSTNLGLLVDRIRVTPPVEALLDVSGNVIADGVLKIHKPALVRVVIRGSRQDVFYQIVAGDPSNPGAVLFNAGLTFGGDIDEVVIIDSTPICNGPSFVRAIDFAGLAGTGSVKLTQTRKLALVDDGTDGATNNAIAVLFQLPANVLAGSIDTTAFPQTVTGVNLRETPTNALVAPGVQVGPGQFAVPLTPVTPNQITLFEQNQLDIELVTPTGSFVSTIVAAREPAVLPDGSPGLNGRVPFANFVQQPLIRFGYGIEAVGGMPNAAAIPVIGLALHDPPQSLAPFGLDDTVYVDILANLPMQLLDGRGYGFWTQPLPNDTTFAGLTLFGQVVVLSGLDGLSMSNTFFEAIGPN